MPLISFAHQWTIAENQLLPLKDSDYGYLFSTSVSNIPEFEYCLNISPNGNNIEHRGETFIFLHLKFKNVKKVEADWTFAIESANFLCTDCDVYETSEGMGTYICSSEELFHSEKKFIVDGKCIIKINGIFKFERIDDAISSAFEQKWDGGKLGDGFWNKEDTKDFIIITSHGGKEINVHKCVLDVRSEVFEAMVKSNMKEASENKVTINDFSFNVVETGIKLIYECNFTSKLSIDELMSLLQFFDKYLLPELKAKVEPFLIAQISAATVVDLTNCSILTNSFKLKEKCMEFLSIAFKSQTPLTDFDDLDKDTVISIIKNSLYGTLETYEQK